MSDDKKKREDAFASGCCTGLGVAIIAVVGTVCLTMWLNDASWRRWAVREGHAEYVAREDGDSQWQWKSTTRALEK